VLELSRLPGIGPRSAQRLAFHLMKAPPERARALSEAIADMSERLRPCSVCFSFAEAELCPICADPRRDATLLCAVEEPSAILPIERTHEYRGRYHVLGGATASTPRTCASPSSWAASRPTASPSS
jgi:recombination protein RecR